MTAQQLIDRHRLEPHPEGGWYREIYRADQTVASPVHDAQRSAFTHIYFLLERGQVSRFHKVSHGEIWNFYLGAPLRLLEFFARDTPDIAVRETVLGSDDASYVAIIEPDAYQAAESTGDFSFVGCSVAPGFDFADFSFLSDDNSELGEKIADSRADYGRFL